MTLATLALIIAVALVGPLLAWSNALRIPVIVGEMVAGVIVGETGLHWIDPGEPTLSFLADVGFAMVMFVAGCHVPVRDKHLISEVPRSLARVGAIAVAAVALGVVVAAGFHTGHAALYAVLFASSSAAVIMPVVTSLRLSGPTMTRLIPQVAVADAVCIVLLPLVIQPGRALHAGVGALLVIGCATAVFVLLRLADNSGWWRGARVRSKTLALALELRVSLLILLVLAALAQAVQVSIMLAGFCLGLAVGAVGQPRRLARQLFGLTEGLFAPIFFVWLGASLNLRDLAVHPVMILLGVVLAAAALAAHAVAALFKLGLPASLFAAAQIGVPVAAVTVGQQQGVLQPGEGAALLLGALLTIAVSAAMGPLLAEPYQKAM